MTFRRIAILGAGSWGTALAYVWSRRGHEIILWGHNAERVQRLDETRENAAYLPGFSLPSSVAATADLSECRHADLVVFVTPSTAIRSVSEKLRPHLQSGAVLLSCTKGIEHGSGLRITQILRDIFPPHQIAVLSGPNLAVEVARELPTATVLGCEQSECAQALQLHLGSPRFRIYTSDETAGIELGGALKNVFAIAAGICDGFGLGDNSKAALVTRSLAELVRIGVAMGGNARTFYGLSGAGDLVATCFSPLSRNRRVGERIGRGESLSEITSSMQMVAEGIPTARSAYECARALGVETPIIDQVYAILHEGKPPAKALEDLLERDQKSERH